MKVKTNILLSLVLATCVSFVIIQNLRKSKRHEIPELLSLDSVNVSNAKFNHKAIIVSYFQTWCSDCVKEQPELLKLQDRFGSDSLSIVMVSDESIEKIIRFKNRFNSGLSFYKTNKSLKKELDVKGFPTTYLLDKNKKIVLSKVEGIHWYTPEIIQSIEKIIRN